MKLRPGAITYEIIGELNTAYRVQWENESGPYKYSVTVYTGFIGDDKSYSHLGTFVTDIKPRVNNSIEMIRRCYGLPVQDRCKKYKF